MTHVLGVLPDEMHEDLSDRHGPPFSQLPEVWRVGDQAFGIRDLVGPGRPRILDHRRVRCYIECSILSIGGLIGARDLLRLR